MLGTVQSQLGTVWSQLGIGLLAETPVDEAMPARLSLAYGSYVTRQALVAGSVVTVLSRRHGSVQTRQPLTSGSLE